MDVRLATVEDLPLLIGLRLDFLQDQGEKLSAEAIDALTEKLRAYFVRAMAEGSFLAVLAFRGTQAVGVAFLSMVERPPRKAFSSYRVGTVYNVYVYPQHRHQGIATHVMRCLIEQAKAQGVGTVDLLATAQGRGVYEKLGFGLADNTYMRLKLG